MSTDLIRYDLLVQDALRAVVRRVLADAARPGFPATIISTSRSRPRRHGVVVPPAIRARFPDEMSIILQHEFWDLRRDPGGLRGQPQFLPQAGAPDDSVRRHHRFFRPVGAVRLQAGAARLRRAVGDPDGPAPLELKPIPPPAPAAKREAEKPAPATGRPGAAPEKGEQPAAAKVVSIDAFRKK